MVFPLIVKAFRPADFRRLVSMISPLSSSARNSASPKLSNTPRYLCSDSRTDSFWKPFITGDIICWQPLDLLWGVMPRRFGSKNLTMLGNDWFLGATLEYSVGCNRRPPEPQFSPHLSDWYRQYLARCNAATAAARDQPIRSLSNLLGTVTTSLPSASCKI